MTQESPRPHGREEIREAVLDAAQQLFGDRMPSQVTVREIAELAGVNHALIHRHFGTKTELVRQVMERIDREVAPSLASLPGTGDVVRTLIQMGDGKHSMVRKTMDHALMDGLSGEELQARSSLAEDLVQRLMDEGSDPQSARLRAAVALAVIMGWHSYESWLVHVTDLGDESPAELRDRVADLIGTILCAE